MLSAPPGLNPVKKIENRSRQGNSTMNHLYKQNHTSVSDRKKIWIDLDNSPHVPFFKPIIEELNSRGYSMMLTARDCFQVCGLADLLNLRYTGIGRHYGKNKILKVIGTILRSFQLLWFAVRARPDFASSLGSRSQLIAVSILRIPIVTIIDYEHARDLPLLKPNLLLVPEVMPDRLLNSYKFRRYPGIKEDVYVSSFKPDPSILNQLGLRDEDLVVTIRPPATEAHYHNPESEKLFFAVVEFLGRNPDIRMVILPRNEKRQTALVKNKWPEWCAEGKIIIPEQVVKGLDLIWYSDFVVSGGGTMNREAAALGVPVYSIFRGKIGAVDKYLAENGRLVLLTNVDDVQKKIVLKHRNFHSLLRRNNNATLNTIINHITSVIEAQS